MSENFGTGGHVFARALFSIAVSAKKSTKKKSKQSKR
jgi:hypothetical protein